jgi:hypothetical protein
MPFPFRSRLRPPGIPATGLIIGLLAFGFLGVFSLLLSRPRPESDLPGFRIRSGISAPLNADEDWAGALDEGVTVPADRPFRIRMEVEVPSGLSHAPNAIGLQVRRNDGPWIRVEAHDFPYPTRTLSVTFERSDAQGLVPDWSFPGGRAEGIAVIEDAGGGAILRIAAEGDARMALYATPWNLDHFKVGGVLRLSDDGMGLGGLVFGYVDPESFGFLTLDPESARVRLGRVDLGEIRILGEWNLPLPRRQWIYAEVQGESGELEIQVSYISDGGDEGDEALRAAVPWDSDLPAEGLGFLVPDGSTAEFRELLIEGEARTPGVSIVAVDAYPRSSQTEDVLKGSGLPFGPSPGGVNLQETMRSVDWITEDAEGGSAGIHLELEWPLVIRRFGDGPVVQNEGDVFRFRLVDHLGTPLPGAPEPSVTLSIPPGHLGGTYVETPGRIGPWQTANGDLYFVMEPTETDNKFLMMKSADQGESWWEVDGENRPSSVDLESVDGQFVDGSIYLLHQITEGAMLHVFHTSDHPTHPDRWGATDERVTSAAADAQLANLVVGPDGRMAAFYMGETVRYSVRDRAQGWGPDSVLDPDLGISTTGPQAILDAEGRIHVAYVGLDGTVWYRRLDRNGTLTPRVALASGVGTTRSEFGAVLPLVYLPRSGTIVVVYRLEDGTLWERRIAADGVKGQSPTPPVQVTDLSVITNAVDSQQPAADVVVDPGTETVHILFVDEESRSLFHTHDRNGWQPPSRVVDGILGSWVRGQIYTRPDGVRVYGYVYDAGSFGGAGMNRFGELRIEGL